MDLSQLIPLIASLASAVAAVLAWVAKIRWADEYSKAKDETIKAKDTLIAVKDAQLQTLITNKDEIIKAKDEQIKVLETEIRSLNELTPMKIREYFLSVREQMEEYNGLLKNQLDEAHEELNNKKKEIETLKQEGEKSYGEIEKLEAERQSIANAAKTLEDQLSTLRKKYERQNAVYISIPKIDTEVYENISNSYKKLAEAMSKDYAQDVAKISRFILESSKFTEQQQEIARQLIRYRNFIAHSDTLRLTETPDHESEPSDGSEGKSEDNRPAA